MLCISMEIEQGGSNSRDGANALDICFYSDNTCSASQMNVQCKIFIRPMRMSKKLIQTHFDVKENEAA